MGLISCRYSTDDIEVALTKLDIDIIKSPENTELRDLRKAAETSLSNYFTQFRYNDGMVKESPWLLDFVREAFAKGDTAVCLNYDCLLEGLLDQCKLWSPYDGYGKCDAIGSVPIAPENSPVKVLKIHGSENFHRNPVWGNQTEKAFLFTTDESIFPISGNARQFCQPREDSEEAIIAPSFVKVFPSVLLCLMIEALNAVLEAEILVLVGCGLRREDTFLYLLLWRFLGPSKRILILDPYACNLSKRLSNTLEYNIVKIVHPIDKPLQEGWSCLTSELKKL